MGPLAGVKVIEIAGIGPGPFAAMMLADMGAPGEEHDAALGLAERSLGHGRYRCGRGSLRAGLQREHAGQRKAQRA
jgi:hypothetical protein